MNVDAEDIFRLVLQQKPSLLEQRSKNGTSVLHTWAEGGKLWPFAYLLKCIDIIPNVRNIVINLISTSRNSDGRNPLHVLASTKTYEGEASNKSNGEASTNINEGETYKIATLLVDMCIQQAKTQAFSITGKLPWLLQDHQGATPLALAINSRNDDFLLSIPLMDDKTLNKYQENILFLAIEKGYPDVVQKILDIVKEKGWTKYLTDQRKRNALHLAPNCKSEYKS